MIRAALCAALCTLLSAPLPAQAAVERRVQAIDALFAAGDAFGPGRELKAALAADPRSYPLLWRGARDGVMLSLALDDRVEVNHQLERATDLGRRAVAVNPTGRDGNYWLAVALARRAQRSGFADAVRLARESHALTAALLAADSMDAGANALIGRLQVELLKLAAPVRWIVTLGLSTGPVSWRGAEAHLARAVSQDSTSVAYRVDHVQWLLRRGELAQADRETALLRALPVRTPADTFFQRDIAARVARAHAAAARR